MDQICIAEFGLNSVEARTGICYLWLQMHDQKLQRLFTPRLSPLVTPLALLAPHLVSLARQRKQRAPMLAVAPLQLSLKPAEPGF